MGVVLSIDGGMCVHINSSLHEIHVAFMGREGSYYLDDPSHNLPVDPLGISCLIH